MLGVVGGDELDYAGLPHPLRPVGGWVEDLLGRRADGPEGEIQPVAEQLPQRLHLMIFELRVIEELVEDDYEARLDAIRERLEDGDSRRVEVRVHVQPARDSNAESALRLPLKTAYRRASRLWCSSFHTARGRLIVCGASGLARNGGNDLSNQPGT